MRWSDDEKTSLEWIDNFCSEKKVTASSGKSIDNEISHLKIDGWDE